MPYAQPWLRPTTPITFDACSMLPATELIISSINIYWYPGRYWRELLVLARGEALLDAGTSTGTRHERASARTTTTFGVARRQVRAKQREACDTHASRRIFVGGRPDYLRLKRTPLAD